MYSKLENKIGVSTSTYMGFPLEDALRGISRAGFSYIEIAAIKGILEHIRPDKITHKELLSLRKKLNQYNLKILSIAAYSDLTKVENVPYLKKSIDLAKKIGAKLIITGVNNEGGDNSKPAISRFYENIRVIGEYAKKNQITIGLETHGGIVSTGEETVTVVKKVNSASVKVSYDTGNVIFHGGVRPENDIMYILDQVGHVHLKDKIGGKGVWNFPPLGDGDIDFLLIFNILEKKGYSGPLSVEVEFQKHTERTLELVNQAVKKSYDFLHRLLSG